MHSGSHPLNNPRVCVLKSQYTRETKPHLYEYITSVCDSLAFKAALSSFTLFFFSLNTPLLLIFRHLCLPPLFSFDFQLTAYSVFISFSPQPLCFLSISVFTPLAKNKQVFLYEVVYMQTDLSHLSGKLHCSSAFSCLHLHAE